MPLALNTARLVDSAAEARIRHGAESATDAALLELVRMGFSVDVGEPAEELVQAVERFIRKSKGAST